MTTRSIRTLVALAMTGGFVLMAGCSNTPGQPSPASGATNTSGPTATVTSTSTPTGTGKVTASDLCTLMTPADFPTQGTLLPNYPEKKDGDFPTCKYIVRTGDITATFVASLTFFPDRKLEPTDFEGMNEVRVGGKRAALGQGKIHGEPGECDLLSESPKGEWMIIVVDGSAPNKDGCVAAKAIGEKVVARVP